MEESWSVPAPDGRVEYMLWSVPSSGIARRFLDSWKPVAEALGIQAYFSPKMWVQDGRAFGCRRNDQGFYDCPHFDLCTDGGRYCAASHEDFESGSRISGAHVVKESLRRICIWNQYGAANGIGVEWWDYVGEFNRRCNNHNDGTASHWFASPDCIEAAYNAAKVNGSRVERCMTSSGDPDDAVHNNLLEVELDYSKRLGVVAQPSLYINSVLFPGSFSVDEIFGALCTGYAPGTEPQVCSECANSTLGVLSCIADASPNADAPAEDKCKKKRKKKKKKKTRRRKKKKTKKENKKKNNIERKTMQRVEPMPSGKNVAAPSSLGTRSLGAASPSQVLLAGRPVDTSDSFGFLCFAGTIVFVGALVGWMFRKGYFVVANDKDDENNKNQIGA